MAQPDASFSGGCRLGYSPREGPHALHRLSKLSDCMARAAAPKSVGIFTKLPENIAVVCLRSREKAEFVALEKYFGQMLNFRYLKNTF